MFFCALHISVYIILSINTSCKVEMAKLSSAGAMHTWVLCSMLKPSYLAVKTIYQSKINPLPVCLMLPFTTVLFQMLRPNSKHTEINRLERLMLIKMGNQFWIGPLEESYHCKEKLKLLSSLAFLKDILYFALCLFLNVVQFQGSLKCCH